ncbi:MAG: PilZ domain-containing protein [Proteobacteria bacterium]|nr:PilZ domain-containing protein [Pseudomonadota bacterium]
MADEQKNRRSGRRRTLFGGKMFDEEGNVWECSVSDISEEGARVKSDAALVAESFVDLKINKFNDLRRCKVMWVREGYIGLQFLVKIDKDKEGMSDLFKLIAKR